MTEKQMNDLFSAARGDSANNVSIDRKFQQLLRVEEHRSHLSFLLVRPMATAAFTLLVLIGGLTLFQTAREVQAVAAHNKQEQVDMMEARRNMLSNTEHIYTILFQRQ